MQRAMEVLSILGLEYPLIPSSGTTMSGRMPGAWAIAFSSSEEFRVIHLLQGDGFRDRGHSSRGLRQPVSLSRTGYNRASGPR